MEKVEMRSLFLLLAVGMCACSVTKSSFPEYKVNIAMAAVRAFANGEHEELSAIFTTELRESFTGNRLEERWLEITNAYGKFNDILSFSIESTPDKDGVLLADFTCHFQQGLVLIRVGIEANGEVVRFDILHQREI